MTADLGRLFQHRDADVLAVLFRALLQTNGRRQAGGTAADAMAYVGRTVLTAGTTAYGRSAGGLAGGGLDRLLGNGEPAAHDEQTQERRP